MANSTRIRFIALLAVAASSLAWPAYAAGPQSDRSAPTPPRADGKFTENDRELMKAVQALGGHDGAAAKKTILALALKGHDAAQNTLAFMHLTGHFWLLSAPAARVWYRWAAETGNLFSARELANIQAAGKTRRDWIEAYKWYEMVRLRTPMVQDANERAKNLKIAAAGHKKLASKLTQAERKSAVEEAVQWKPRAQPEPLLYETVSRIETAIDYNRECQRLSTWEGGVHDLERLVQQRPEEVQLRACLVFISELLKQKQCDGRDPEFRELLFYMQYLDRAKGVLDTHAAGALATALVTGRYCEPEAPSPTGMEAILRAFREAYEDTKRKRAAPKT